MARSRRSSTKQLSDAERAALTTRNWVAVAAHQRSSGSFGGTAKQRNRKLRRDRSYRDEL